AVDLQTESAHAYLPIRVYGGSGAAVPRLRRGLAEVSRGCRRGVLQSSILDRDARAADSNGRRSGEPPPGLRALAREPQPWVLAAFTILLFFEPLFLSRTLSLRDLANWAIPQRHRLVELWKSSGVPLRDPFIHGGLPFLADPNNAALY